MGAQVEKRGVILVILPIRLASPYSPGSIAALGSPVLLNIFVSRQLYDCLYRATVISVVQYDSSTLYQ